MFIPFRSWFFAYWIITLSTLAYWAWFRSTWECIIVVLLQTAGLWRYYQSTLMVGVGGGGPSVLQLLPTVAAASSQQ